ncbi:hypothetical protein [Mycolicibacterium hippocampi]|uniref:Uncharacterized protein n=1 Tax=Mycolicibacterium hippocampi TaxID=659824 RepID=A0A7I9ZM00_9MYCO|nr:hypothetical protein [Mycolicibacterium hippocampi]GFH02060.1 hypothetical protein MHIP_25430 [Mycolicibacterium hippocampi]
MPSDAWMFSRFVVDPGRKFECNVHADEKRKNELTRPVPLPYNHSDYLRCAIANGVNMSIWLTEPAIVKWINESRIDLFSPILDFESEAALPTFRRWVS